MASFDEQSDITIRRNQPDPHPQLNIFEAFEIMLDAAIAKSEELSSNSTHVQDLAAIAATERV